MDKGTTVEVEGLRRNPGQGSEADSSEVPEEPTEACCCHEQAGATLWPPVRRDEPARDENPADRQVGDPVARIVPPELDSLGRKSDGGADRPKEQAGSPHHLTHPTSSASAAPDSRLLGMNPRALV